MQFSIERNGNKVTGRIAIGPESIDIFFDGYGLDDTEAGHASVVYIEPDDDGHPVLRAWDDIHSGEVTHRINFANCREELRAEL